MEETEIQEQEMPETTETEIPAGEEDFTKYDEHIWAMEQQAEAMQADFPDFSLQRELQNPVFLQLTAPGTGISVADAYYALHRQQIQENAVRETREKVVSAIASGARRPLEAGTSGQGPSLTTFRYDNASKEQRDAFKKELRRAWGRGETVYPR